MSTTQKNANGVVDFGGTLQERQRLNRQILSATKSDRLKNSSLRGKGLLRVGFLLGVAALVAALWICSSYNVSHDHVLSSPIGDERLNMPSGR
ncbi:MAG: hypothetical protein P4L53_28680 [Candidatus Obscuribacterales bacterium]|nr:hypothetical protein [Candidatus Obscuribacterales bacterium]